MMLAEPLTERLIGLAIEVHRHTGPGLLESVYEQCLCNELTQAGLSFERQVAVRVIYKAVPIGDGCKADIVVARQLILEIKAVAAILPAHEAQLHTYLRKSGLRMLTAQFQCRAAGGRAPSLRRVGAGDGTTSSAAPWLSISSSVLKPSSRTRPPDQTLNST